MDLAERLVVHTVTGARFEVWQAAAPPDLPALGRVAATHLPRLRDEPYDLYTASGPGYAAVELRSLAGFSVLELAVLVDGQPLRARVHQEDEARWTAEEDGLIGEAFEDFRERNALWTGLGGRRPGGWTLTVVEPGEPTPALLSP